MVAGPRVLDEFDWAGDQAVMRPVSPMNHDIAEGEAGPGDKLPQAKDLAAVLGVNPNTVLRALRILRDEGLLELGRGKAITVAGTPERGAVLARLRDLVDFASQYGYRRDELIIMLKNLS